MSRSFRLAAWCLCALASPADAVTQDAIRDPRPRSAVTDTTGTLGIAEIGAIDSLAVRARSRGELVVVVIDSTGGVAPRAFTTQLFNRLRLDTRERNRGVILLAAIRDRKAEIVLGDGYPAAATQITDRIMRDVVVARFKAGRPREAMVEGARALVDQLIFARAAVPPPPPPPPPGPVEGSIARATEFALNEPLLALSGTGSALAGAIALVRLGLRRRPRRCRTCSTTMVRLGEAADDAHLTTGERTEERVGSADYDVWACPACRHTLKLRYGALVTSYAACGKCGAKTLRSQTTTLTSPTTSSEGVAQVDDQCAHCGLKQSYRRSIPRVEESSSDSSWSSSSDSGGSSSGGGSSGSW